MKFTRSHCCPFPTTFGWERSGGNRGFCKDLLFPVSGLNDVALIYSKSQKSYWLSRANIKSSFSKYRKNLKVGSVIHIKAFKNVLLIQILAKSLIAIYLRLMKSHTFKLLPSSDTLKRYTNHSNCTLMTSIIIIHNL